VPSYRAPQVRVAHSVAVTEPTALAASAQKARKIAYGAAAVVVVLFTAISFSLHGKTDSGKSVFHTEDQVAMIILGVLAAGAILLFTRPRIIADASGLRIRNLLGWVEVPWDLVAAIRYDRGTPWAQVELTNDDMIAIMAVQAADKDYAVQAVRTLRRMLAEKKAARST
jgi:hypothetical protein